MIGCSIDTSGNVYTAGNFAEPADFDPGPSSFELSSPGAFISVLDRNGEFVWAGSFEDFRGLAYSRTRNRGHRHRWAFYGHGSRNWCG